MSYYETLRKYGRDRLRKTDNYYQKSVWIYVRDVRHKGDFFDMTVYGERSKQKKMTYI
jgi:hypothetical protein